MEVVQIVSRETIKPAGNCRTKLKNDQKTFKVSFMDMLSPECYIPITFFYPMNETNCHFNKEETTCRLKLSLSKALAQFPILAARIKGNLIHSYDGDEDEDEDEDDIIIGALFVDANIQITMAEFLKSPNLNLLPKFLPFPFLSNQPLERAMQIGVQVNFFSCGGIGIGLSLLHTLIDATTMSCFIKCWAAFSEDEGILFEKLGCGGGDYSVTCSLFPYREISDGFRLISSETPFVVEKGKKSTTRRFYFDGKAISNLKEKAKSTRAPNPTTVEVTTCFIWKYAMKAASRCKSLDVNKERRSFANSEWQSVLVHIVNMRKRINPPLSENNIGNIYWRSCAYFKSLSNKDTHLTDLQTILRQSISEINNKNFIQQAITSQTTLLSSLRRLHRHYAKCSESYLFTSWRNMGFNEVNFGWGKPVWVAAGGNVFDSITRNLVILMDTMVGNGLEAWVVLDDETMNLLENDYEFLQFASPNPSIC
ncbi:stemmadenine O-acetyltransferase-like [Benincasa hispida]|uniref:stemmadenine O-acetyltransferase-like n=1 Tax=Benincasa hispida TaxID=102211 RepID=UPI0018FF7394|nr:stemmadenine O-acetyltransferase-like [Benincasa hispida]